MKEMPEQKSSSKREKINKEKFSSDEDSIDKQYGHLYKKQNMT